MDNLYNDIYKNKKVFITGHTGFKGGWLSLWLKELGAEVLGYSLKPNVKPNIFSICRIEDEITSAIGDIRDKENLTKVILDFKPDIIFHLAAQPLVRQSYIDPKLTYDTNVIGTLNLYEAARKSTSVKAIVSITTDKCYENKEWVYGYRENDQLGGYDPYSSSKACVEILSSSYRRSFFAEKGIFLATTRAGNVIGGGDWAEDRLIPDFVRAVLEDKPIIIRNSLATRPWQHVLEPLSGYLALGAELLKGNNDFATAWNFGPYDSDILNVCEIIGECINVWGRGSYELDKSFQPHEANSLKLDISKVKTELRWKPVENVYKAINNTILWYKEYYEGNSNMKEYTINQIEEYVLEAQRQGVSWSVN